MVAGHRVATRGGNAASNITLERSACSHPLAAAAQRARSASERRDVSEHLAILAVRTGRHGRP
jgi:hypothetical protein